MTQVIILAAGKGTRLKPLTNNNPKCLVKFLGKKLLDYQIESLNHFNITNIHLVAGHLEKKIQNKKITKSINQNYKKSNMVSSFFSCKDIINKKKDLLIIYGDIIFTKKNLKKIFFCPNDISMMVDIDYLKYWKIRMENPLDDLETLVLNKLGLIKEIGKKTKNYKKIHGQYTGLIKISKRTIPKLINFYENLDKKKIYDNKNFDNMYMTSFFQLLIKKKWSIKAVKVKNGWLEFDTFQDYKIYNNLHKNNKLKSIFDYK